MNDDADLEVIGSTRRRASAFSVPGLRWWMMALIMLGSILNYLTRQTLSVAQVHLQGTLGISEAQYSWITGAFQLSIMLQPICGYVLDVVGLKFGLAFFVAAWSVISMGTRGRVRGRAWRSFAGSWVSRKVRRTRRG